MLEEDFTQVLVKTLVEKPNLYLFLEVLLLLQIYEVLLCLVPLSRFLLFVLFVFCDEAGNIQCLPLLHKQVKLVQVNLFTIEIVHSLQKLLCCWQMLYNRNDLVSGLRIKEFPDARTLKLGLLCIPFRVLVLLYSGGLLHLESGSKQRLHLLLVNKGVLFDLMPNYFFILPCRVNALEVLIGHVASLLVDDDTLPHELAHLLVGHDLWLVELDGSLGDWSLWLLGYWACSYRSRWWSWQRWWTWLWCTHSSRHSRRRWQTWWTTWRTRHTGHHTRRQWRCWRSRGHWRRRQPRKTTWWRRWQKCWTSQSRRHRWSTHSHAHAHAHRHSSSTSSKLPQVLHLPLQYLIITFLIVVHYLQVVYRLLQLFLSS